MKHLSGDLWLPRETDQTPGSVVVTDTLPNETHDRRRVARRRNRSLFPLSLLFLTVSCDVVEPTISPLAVLGPTSNCHLLIWLKAFIDPTTTNPGYVTTVLPPAPQAGKSALRAWFVDAVGPDIFLTDARGPIPSETASSRMHSEVRFVVAPGGAPQPTASDQKTGITVAFDRNIAGTADALKCALIAPTTGMSWSNHFQAGMTYSLHLSASAKDPCLVYAPTIDYAGDLIVTNFGSYVLVRFEGNVDGYPSFEMYARDNNGVTKRLVYWSNNGNNPLNLFGGPRNPVGGAVEMCRRHDQGGG